MSSVKVNKDAIRAAIKKVGWTQAQTSFVLEKSDSYMSNALTTGLLDSTVLARLSAIFGEPQDSFILTEKEVEEAPTTDETVIQNIDKTLSEMLEALERISTYTSQTNAKLQRLCEELLTDKGAK